MITSLRDEMTYYPTLDPCSLGFKVHCIVSRVSTCDLLPYYLLPLLPTYYPCSLGFKVHCIASRVSTMCAPYSERCCNPRSRCHTVTVQWSCIALHLMTQCTDCFRSWCHLPRLVCVLFCARYGSYGFFCFFPRLSTTGEYLNGWYSSTFHQEWYMYISRQQWDGDIVANHCREELTQSTLAEHIIDAEHFIDAEHIVRTHCWCRAHWQSTLLAQSTLAEHIDTENIGRADYWRGAHLPAAATLHSKLLSTLMTLPLSSLVRDKIILLCTLSHLSLQSILKEIFNTFTSNVHCAVSLKQHSVQ